MLDFTHLQKTGDSPPRSQTDIIKYTHVMKNINNCVDHCVCIYGKAQPHVSIMENEKRHLAVVTCVSVLQ